MLVIRNFKRDDILEVSSLIAKTFNRNYDPEFYLSVYERWHDGFLIAHDTHGVIGVCVAMISAPKTARILLMAVRNEHRNRGIGAQLLKELIDRCILLDIKAMTLEVRISNKPGIRFYENHSFAIKSIITDYYEDGEAGYLMKRVL
jgi:ribosomal-protein-alanine N-acetyltransferase